MQVAHFLDAPILAWTTALASALYVRQDSSDRGWEILVSMLESLAHAVVSSPPAQQLPLHSRLRHAPARLHQDILSSCLTTRPDPKEAWELYLPDGQCSDHVTLPPAEGGLKMSWRDLAVCGNARGALNSITWLHLCPEEPESAEISPENDSAASHALRSMLCLRELVISDKGHLEVTLHAIGSPSASPSSLQMLWFDGIDHLKEAEVQVLTSTLASLHALRVLVLPPGNESGYATSDLLAAVAQLPGLEHLLLPRGIAQDSNCSMLKNQAVLRFTSLGSLTVCLPESPLASLLSSLKLASPRSLVLWRNGSSRRLDRAMQLLSLWRHSLRSVDIVGIMPEVGVPELRENPLGLALANLPGLTSLKLALRAHEYPHFQALKNSAVLSELADCSHLRRLVVDPLAMATGTAAEVLPQLSALTQLHIGHHGAAKGLLIALRALPPHLERLSFSHTALRCVLAHATELGDPQTAFEFPTVPQHLSAIDFRNTLMPGYLAGRVLAGLPGVAALRSLRFDLFSTDDDSNSLRLARAAAALQNLTQLRALALCGCALCPADAEQLMLALPSRLTSLDMSDWQCGGGRDTDSLQPALCSAIEAGTLSALQRLDLSGTRIPPAHLGGLTAALSTLPELAALLLRRGSVPESLSDAAAATLAKGLPACAALRRLDLTGHCLSVQAVLELQHALPLLRAESDAQPGLCCVCGLGAAVQQR